VSANFKMRIKTELLPDGVSLKHPVHDDQGRLLIEAATPLDASVKGELLSRGVDWVVLHQNDALEVMGLEDQPAEVSPAQQPIKQTPPRTLPSLGRINAKIDALENTVALSVENSGPPLQDSVISKGSVPYDVERDKALTEQYHSAKQLLDELIQEAVAGTARDSQSLDFVVAKYVEGLIDDTDLVISSSERAAPNPMLTDRSIRTAILAMSLAIEMKFDEQHVREIGLCGLAQDWGMLHLPEYLRDARTPVSEEDWAIYKSHPLYTAEMLSSVDGVSREVRLAATQGFENSDGSGYPRGLKHDEIHPYAGILHVVNVYLALTTDTHGRKPYVAYDVMVYMLHQIKAGRVAEQPMRALLNVVSLFPIGSHVRLADGSEAKVIRRNQSHYTTPIIQPVGSDRKFRVDAPEQPVINLAESEGRVMMALPSPEREEIRIEQERMNDVLWDCPRQ
jgi:HD-GYP domain-containing protein (c-di-GMP phosphodiesterase class II)